MLTANEWQKRKMCVNLGKINKKTGKKIKKFLNEISSKQYSVVKSQKIVDGFGARRVSREIEKILEMSS